MLAGIRLPRVGPGRSRTRPDRLIADKGCTSRANRQTLAARGIKITISERDDQLGHRRRRGAVGGRPYAFDPDIYKHRNVVERGFNRFKTLARTCLPTRHDRRLLPRRAHPGQLAAVGRIMTIQEAHIRPVRWVTSMRNSWSLIVNSTTSRSEQANQVQ